MTISAHGIDGFLLVVAALCFLVGAIFAWTGRGIGHPAAVLLFVGLLAWVLTDLVH
jgi:hypothetical protein